MLRFIRDLQCPLNFSVPPQIVDAASCRVAAAGSRCHLFAGFRQNISKRALKHEFSEVSQSRNQPMPLLFEQIHVKALIYKRL